MTSILVEYKTEYSFEERHKTGMQQKFIINEKIKTNRKIFCPKTDHIVRLVILYYQLQHHYFKLITDSKQNNSARS